MKKYPVVWFVLVTVAWSWLWWVPGVLWYVANQPETLPAFLFVLALIGAFGPSVAAVLLTRLRGEPVRDLLALFTRWRHSLVWYAFALLLPLGIVGVAVLISAALGQNFNPNQVGRALLLAPLVFLTALPFGPLGEELGWRGFMLPHLLRKHTPLLSSLIIGFVWAMWHLPLFWVPGAALAAIRPLSVGSVGLYTLNLMALSVLYTLLFTHTRGSVLMAVLFHAAVNSSGSIVFPIFANLEPAQILRINDITVVVTVLLALGLSQTALFKPGPNDRVAEIRPTPHTQRTD